MNTQTESWLFKGGPLDGLYYNLKRADNGKPPPNYCKTLNGQRYWYTPVNGVMEFVRSEAA